jgi:hypothetical protein
MLKRTFEWGVSHPHPHEDIEVATSKACGVVNAFMVEGWSSAKARPNLSQVAE